MEADETIPAADAQPEVAEAEAEPARPARLSKLDADFAENTIEIGENITVIGTIRGKGNVVRIGPTRDPQTLYLTIHGNANKVVIGKRSLLQGLRVDIGSKRWTSSRSRLVIGDGFSTGSHGRFLLPNSGNVIKIGRNCMFSSSVQLRGGEYPHMIFDKETKEYLDLSDGIFIGNHAWIGEGAFIGKSVTIPDECIVGARSVVTRRFDEEHAVIAGNPAKIVKRGVQWTANIYTLSHDHPDYRDSFAHSRVGRINRKERATDLVAAVAPAKAKDD